MSVYTRVADNDIRALLLNYNIGEFQSLEGIAQGITNSNFFLHTNSNTYVLTIFEALSAEELPFFLRLTEHLSANGVACPKPIAQKNGRLDAILSGKPACIVSRLSGRDTSVANEKQCFSTGAMLAKMHLASQSFNETMDNPRDDRWWNASVQKLMPLLSQNDGQLLSDEIQFLAQNPDAHLPRGIIHADLFKDNVLLDNDEVAGFIDFYYACTGSFIYDIAIAINDWARLVDNRIDETKKAAFLAGYQSVRVLSEAETNYLNTAQRAGCVRFWVSRLLDYHFPAEGEMTFIKDPNVFRDLLLSLREK